MSQKQSNTQPKYDLAIFITRAQPFHLGHQRNVELALQVAKEVVVIVGSSGGARDIRNPFTFEERANMIRETFASESSRLHIRPLRDFPYNDNVWASYVQKIVGEFTTGNKTVAVVGHRKEDTAYYLDMFPQWEYVECPRTVDICATDLRAMFFEPTINSDRLDSIAQYVSSSTHQFLKDFKLSDATRDHAIQLTVEFDHIRKYRKAWEAAPYAPTFVTVDAVVIQAGHILLIKRKAAPGKGLYAMPGGFLNPGERIIDGMFRELDEETKIKVPQKVLRGSVVGKEVYDFPGRSLRGRVITHAFAIQLPESKLSKVKGSDDAEKAFWVPINEFYMMQDKFFEDHWYVIDDMLTRFLRT